MWNSIKERIFPLIIALSALSVSASAAVYSVTGLSMLFAGASTAVIIMAASLEVAKLVIASLLYQYWGKLNKILRVYLTIAAAVLILITSAGIYGYLSSAYQKTADQTSIVDSKVASLETKKKLFEETRDNILKEKQSIASLQGTLSQSSTTQYTDKKGNLVVRSNNAVIKNIESASKSNEKLSGKIDVVNDSIFALESKILEIKTTAVGESELGPLKYLSKLTGVAMDRIINWYILVIIFVFDPLAIALVIAANFAFAQLIRRKETPLEENVEDMRKVVNAYDDLKDEMKEWEEASLTDLRDDIYWGESKQQEGVPVMVDPKTGKFFYEEPEIEVKMSGEPSLDMLDLDGDGVIELDELEEVFDKADTNDDGIIDAEEASLANLSPEMAKKLNILNKSITAIKDINDTTSYDWGWKKDTILSELENIKKVSMEIGAANALKNQLKNDDNTITYF
jgi:hypothetical protein